MAKKPRKPKGLPYLECSGGFWWYRPYIPKKQRDDLKVDSRGRLAAICLGRVTDQEWAIREAHAAAMKSISMTCDKTMYSLVWMNEQYMGSAKFRSKAPKTQTDAVGFARILKHRIEVNGREATLGDLHPRDLTKPTLRTILDDRHEEYRANGRQGGSQCNRELSHLSVVIKWCLERYDEYAGLINPCLGLERFEENVNKRYVKDNEYLIQLEVAAEYLDYLPVVFELAYLTATRGIEVTELMLTNIIRDPDTGKMVIKVERRKGSKDTYIEITQRLQAAINAAKALHRSRKYTGMYLVPGARSAKMNRSTLNTSMQRLKERMDKAGKGDVFWTLHDLKRKGISDADDKRIAGHLTEAMRQRYDVKIHAYKAPK